MDSHLLVKVTDTALSRDLFPNDYHCLGDNENRPVKWLPLEALLDRRFLPAGDVVSSTLFSHRPRHRGCQLVIMSLNYGH